MKNHFALFSASLAFAAFAWLSCSGPLDPSDATSVKPQSAGSSSATERASVPMEYQISIGQLYCARTQDSTGPDEAKIVVVADGTKVFTAEKSMNVGSLWTIGKTFKFTHSISIKFFDLDTSPDPSDLVGEIAFEKTNLPYFDVTHIGYLQENGAKYTTDYSLTRARTTVRLHSQTGLSAETGNEKRYSFTVPEGAVNVRFQLFGSDPDADLFVAKNYSPTRDKYDACGINTWSYESVELQGGGAYFVFIDAYEAYTGLDFLVTYQIDKR